MRKIQQMPTSLATLFHDFSNLLMPYEVKYDLVWALVYLNLKVRLNALSQKILLLMM